MTSIKQSPISKQELIETLRETRARTLELVEDLSDEQLMGPRLRIVNPTRWDLPLPSRAKTVAFMKEVLVRVCDTGDKRDREPIDEYDENYFFHLALFHEQMHAEAITYTRQTLCYSPPRLSVALRPPSRDERTVISGDAHVPGGTFVMGDSPGVEFQFDNELQAHEVEVAPF